MYYLVKSFSDDIINLMNYDIEEVVFMYFDKFLDSLKLAFRQKAAVYDAVEFFKNFFLNGFSIKKIFVGFMVVIELLGCLVFDTPRTPRGQELNLDGYSLVFFDDFDGGDIRPWVITVTLAVVLVVFGTTGVTKGSPYDDK